MKIRDCQHHGRTSKRGRQRSHWRPGELSLSSIMTGSSLVSLPLQTGWPRPWPRLWPILCPRPWPWPSPRYLTINKTKIIITTIDHKYDDGHEYLHDRFLAKEFGFAGRDNAEQAQADEMVDIIVDLIDEQVFIFLEFVDIFSNIFATH